MIDRDKPLTINDLVENLKITAGFTAWRWGNENKLTIKLVYDDIEIAEESVYIEPAGYAKEETDEW